MRKPGHSPLTRRTAITAAAALAVVVAGGGYALASTDGNQPMPGNNGATLLYLAGSNVNVGPHSTGQGAAVCPSNMYPVGGGSSSSSRGQWELQSSYADSSSRRARHPDEWTATLFNDSNSRASFKVYAVCSTAGSASSNY
jgi:hypothetical protein